LEDISLIEVSYQPIELCKLLKIANMVGGGGEAKIVISEGYVYVNGEVEFQKRKKVYHQDIIEFNGEVIEVTCSSPIRDVKKVKTIKPEKSLKTEMNKRKSSKEKKYTQEIKEDTVLPGRRKRISF
jgi:ribosome-associated protein